MIFIEMARNDAHGGGTWAFPNCVWAPTEKRGGGSWPFWKKVLSVREGDTIIHLRGVSPKALFVGYSTASGDGFETSSRPTLQNDWEFSEKFYRADLTGFVQFHQPVNLSQIFLTRQTKLGEYFDRNKMRGSNKLNLFYVKQSNRLQCLNGGYFSDVDEELLSALFGLKRSIGSSGESLTVVSVETGSQIATIQSRLGQTRFSREVKRQYGNRCCFPGCTVSDPRFLIASHIARWSDSEALRGQLGNGLCFCLIHDKAFEIGMFTLDQYFKVFVNPKERKSDTELTRDLIVHHSQQISLAPISPLEDALLEHWIRVGIEPFVAVN